MKEKSLKLFFISTFLISFILWIIPMIFGLNSIFAYILFALGGIIPSTMGVMLAYKTKDKKYWHSFWKRVINFKLIDLKSYLFIIIFMPLINILAMYLNYFISGMKPDFTTFFNYLKDPFSLLLLIIYILFLGPIVEELGWRGFAMDHLEKKYKWFIASIILSAFWAFWHIPLIFINGSYQYTLLQDSYLYIIDFMLAFLPTSIMIGYLYYRNNKSILSAILFHYVLNFSGQLFNIPNDSKPYRTLLMYVGTLIIIILNERKNFIKALDV